MHTARLLINRLLGRDTTLTTTLLGQPLTFAIEARREIQRVFGVDEEADLVQQMRPELTHNDVVYDIGANIGVISLLTAMHGNNTVTAVHSFEPEPRNHAQLLRNIALNNQSHIITAHQLALGADNGNVALHVRGNTGDGRHSIATQNGAKDTINVALKTTDQFVSEGHPAPTVLKIDVEGAEGQVLAGMASLMQSAPPRSIFMEVHAKGGKDLMPDGGTIHDWLTAFGYSLTWKMTRGSGEHRHYKQENQQHSTAH